MTTLLPLQTEDQERLPIPVSKRFKPLRSGVQNIWQHDSVLAYRDGHMLNRGVNGTGKSIFLGLQIPFLFDGRQAYAVPPVSTSGQRGSLRDLLLDGRKHQSRVGYTWIEFGRRDDNGFEFVTCGAGLRSSQSAGGVATWYFVTDRRIGADVELFHHDGRPLDAGELRAALGRDHVFDDQTSYRAAVDAAIFGIGPDRLRRLTTILRSLSRPNLASNLDAERAGEFITDFLEPLPEQLFEQIAEHYGKLDALAQRSHVLHDHVATMDHLLAAHGDYARAVVRVVAHRLRKADSEFSTVGRERREAQDKLDEAEAALAAAVAAAEDARMHAAGLDEHVQTLETSDAVRAVHELAEAKRQLDKAQQRLAAAEADTAGARATADEMRTREASAAQRVHDMTAEWEAASTQAIDAAAEASLADDHAQLEGRLSGGGREAAARGLLDATMKRRRRAVETLRRLDSEWRAATQRSQSLLEAFHHREGDRDDAKAMLSQAIAHRDEALTALRVAVEDWAAACSELRVDDAGMAALASAVESRVGPARVVEQLVAPQRDAILAARAEAEQARREAIAAVDALEVERADIAAERDEGPLPVPWRRRLEGRPGAPLWAICDFAQHLDSPAQAGLEAALEAAGLLDAWVLPDGGLLADSDQDATLVTGAPVEGPSLADVLIADGDTVPAATVSSVLRRIGLDRLDVPVSVTADGRYAVGPLLGRSRKALPEHIGAAARDRRRRERLAAIDEQIAHYRDGMATIDQQLADLLGRGAALAADVGNVPDDAPLRQADAAIAPARMGVETATARLEEARERHAKATTEEETARRELTRTALEAGLSAWLDDLDGLVARGDHYQRTAWFWIAAAEERARAALEVELRQSDAAHASRTLEKRVAAEHSARIEATEYEQRHAALKEAAGAGAEETMRLLGAARRERDAARAAAEQATQDREAAGKRHARLEEALAGLAEKFETQVASRDVAAARFRLVIAAGMLECAGWHSLREQLDVHVESAALRRLLTVARADQVGDRPPDQEDVGRRHNVVIAAWPDAHGKLVDYRPMLTGGENEPPYHIPVAEYRGEVRPLREVRDLVEADAQLNDDLINAEERRFFDEVMLAEVTRQLNEALRDAEEQIARINSCVLQRPTRRGHRVRLRWGLRPADVPEGTRHALDLVALHPQLQDDEGRRTLTQWLRERVAEAREQEDGTLQDRLSGAFDYRTWHRVEVQLCMPESNAWERFNSKRAILSEGERAALLHLPLFAAVATAYDNARPGAPRIFALDEAFERIDDGMRAAAFHVIADLDLDVLMANFSMMPTYDTVSGIAINIMSMVPDTDGVGIIEMTWDGERLVELES